MKISKKLIIAISLVLLVIYFIPYGIFNYFYIVEMNPKIDQEISSFIDNLSQTTDQRAKVKEITNYVMKDYYQTYGSNSNPFLSFSWAWFYQIFGDIKNPRIKSYLLFSNDPYFISYYKTGACMEAATLFNFTANKSGFESRIVGTKAEDHQWNEIKINNTWIQVDPTIYYHYYTDPMNHSSYEDLWFDNPQAYNQIGWYQGGYSKVVVIDTNEDLTSKYCNASNLSINCSDCDYIKIKPDYGTRYSVEQDISNSTIDVVLGKKNYSVTGGKNVIPFLIVKETSVNASLIGQENLTITVVPEKIRPTIYSSLILILIIVVIGFYDVKQLAKWYRGWKIKRD